MVAVGAGTAAAKEGGTVAIAEIVGVGDQVTVTYRKVGNGAARRAGAGDREEEVGRTVGFGRAQFGPNPVVVVQLS